MKGRITPARARALDVLVTHGRARVGLGMYEDRPDDPIVTPAAESWLTDMGYATAITGDVAGHSLEPTASGIAAHVAGAS